MAVDKLVDSSQLDADLTSVANAIRTKGGTSGQLAFPSGFVSAVQAIPTGTTPTGTKQITIAENGTVTEDVTNYASAEITVNVQGGGGADVDALLENTLTVLRSNATKIRSAGLQNASTLTEIYLPNCTRIENSNALQGCTGLTLLSIPVCEYIGQSATNLDTRLTTLIAPNVKTVGVSGLKSIRVTVLCFPKLESASSSAFEANTALTTMDYGPDYIITTSATGIFNYTFNGCTAFNTFILRRTASVVNLLNINAFQNTPFASGGTGGTLYVPQALIASYEAATNWSTILGYANNSIQAIEGSVYENAYADGTPIS